MILYPLFFLNDVAEKGCRKLTEYAARNWIYDNGRGGHCSDTLPGQHVVFVWYPGANRIND